MVGNPDYFPVRFFLSRHCLPCVLGENTTDTIKLQYRQEKCLLAIVTNTYLSTYLNIVIQ